MANRGSGVMSTNVASSNLECLCFDSIKCFKQCTRRPAALHLCLHADLLANDVAKVMLIHEHQQKIKCW